MKLALVLLFLMYLPPEKISVENAWIRNSLKGMNTAVFFDAVNKSKEADTLYKVTSNLAELVQIHETYKQGDMMGMREVKNVVIEANSSFKFRPGAHHVMLIKLKEDLKEGDTGEVVFFFKRAGEIKLNLPVKKMIMN